MGSTAWLHASRGCDAVMPVAADTFLAFQVVLTESSSTLVGPGNYGRSAGLAAEKTDKGIEKKKAVSLGNEIRPVVLFAVSLPDNLSIHYIKFYALPTRGESIFDGSYRDLVTNHLTICVDRSFCR